MKAERIEAPICKQCEDRPVMTLHEKKPNCYTYICPVGHKNDFRYKFPIETKDMGKSWVEV